MTRITIFLAATLLSAGCIGGEVAMCDDAELAAAEETAAAAEAQGATPGHKYVDLLTTLNPDGSVRTFHYSDCFPTSLDQDPQ